MIDEPKRSQLATTIIALRARKVWSHDALALHATKLLPHGEKLSAKTVGNIEADRHNPTLGKLKAIAAALDVEVWQLFLPASPHPSLVRDITLEIVNCSEEDQRDTLKLIRKLRLVAGPQSERPIIPTRRANAS